MRRLIIRGVGRFREVGEWGVWAMSWKKDLGGRRLLPRAGLDAVWSGLVCGAGHQDGRWRCGGSPDLEK